mmetsp:Transcript_73697/g.134784  ORF Transcript_73697/g.134784 Transcript_73697/m.134784 type:complete len:274 (+) Transcript_73697:77-898(+)
MPMPPGWLLDILVVVHTFAYASGLPTYTSPEAASGGAFEKLQHSASLLREGIVQPEHEPPVLMRRETGADGIDDNVEDKLVQCRRAMAARSAALHEARGGTRPAASTLQTAQDPPTVSPPPPMNEETLKAEDDPCENIAQLGATMMSGHVMGAGQMEVPSQSVVSRQDAENKARMHAYKATEDMKRHDTEENRKKLMILCAGIASMLCCCTWVGLFFLRTAMHQAQKRRAMEAATQALRDVNAPVEEAGEAAAASGSTAPVAEESQRASDPDF